MSRLQLSDHALERLGQKPSNPTSEELPDVVFYTGCNVLKRPHIALLCLDIMDALGMSYRVMGGPSHCCGVIQFRAGDLDTSSRVSGNTIQKLSRSKTGQVLAWCPSCFVQFSENMLPTFKQATGETPFDMTPFMRFLRGKLDELRPHLRNPVPMRVALHKHPGVAGVVEAVEDLLRAVPGIEIVQLGVPAVGLQSATVATLPAYKRALNWKSSKPRVLRASTRSSPSITPITANCAPTNAIGRSASSMYLRLSATAWGSGRTTITSI